MALHGYSQLTLRFLYRAKWRTPMLCIDRSPTFLPSASKCYKRYASSYGGPPLPGQVLPPLGTEDAEEKATPRTDEQDFRWRSTLFKMMESAATTLMSIMVLGFVLFELRKRRAVITYCAAD
jgi:hypothetical protein